jgi:hypothetical protein
MGRRAGTVTESARVLGVDYVLARLRSAHLKVRKLRISSAKRSLNRIMLLQKVSAKAGRLYVAGYLLAVTFWAEVHGLTVSEGRRLRVGHHKAAGVWVPGANADVLSACKYSGREPVTW